THLSFLLHHAHHLAHPFFPTRRSSDLPTPQHPCTRSSSNSTTTLACEPNQFPKNPSARRSMIAPSQPKKASAFNEDGKDSNPTRHAGARHTFLPITRKLCVGCTATPGMQKAPDNVGGFSFTRCGGRI